MPFSENGLVPDIIVNPNAFPKRMTIAQLIEGLFAKLGVLTGKTCDATPFNEIDINAINEQLKSYGFDDYGNETMYNGITGEKIDAKIYICPNYYQRLKHMVDDKIHARAKGSVQTLTRQPPEGLKHQNTKNNIMYICIVGVQWP